MERGTQSASLGVGAGGEQAGAGGSLGVSFYWLLLFGGGRKEVVGRSRGRKQRSWKDGPVHCRSGRSQSGWFGGYLGAGRGFHCGL